MKQICNTCGVSAVGKSKINAVFGFRTVNGVSKAKAKCKECRKKRREELRTQQRNKPISKPVRKTLKEVISKVVEKQKTVIVKFTASQLQEMLTDMKKAKCQAIGVKVDLETGKALN